MAKFQTGLMRGKGVTDNLFILRDIIDHSNYLEKNYKDIPGSLWNFQVDSGMVTLLTLKNYCVYRK